VLVFPDQPRSDPGGAVGRRSKHDAAPGYRGRFAGNAHQLVSHFGLGALAVLGGSQAVAWRTASSSAGTTPLRAK
jgi:hypothetical protein